MTEKDRASDLGAWDARPLADGGVVMAVARSTGPEPWDVWAGRAETTGQKGSLRAISSHQDALAGIVWGRQEAFTWTAPDGRELDGLLVRPPAIIQSKTHRVALWHSDQRRHWGVKRGRPEDTSVGEAAADDECATLLQPARIGPLIA